MEPGVSNDMGVAAAATLDYDAELMLRVKDGDGTSFGVLLEKHRASVIHFVYRLVQEQAVAEELAQEVFLRVYRSRSSYEPTAKFKTWLFRIATHLALNWLRDEKHERGQERLDDVSADLPARQVSDRRPSVEQELVYEVKLEEIRQAMAALPEKQRAAVLMHKYEEMEYTQIAKVLGCSESAVKSLLFRAYETLRARLAHMGNDMNCPIESRNPEMLVAYAAGELDLETARALERHLAGCAACRSVAADQAAVWKALDAWEAPAVSPDFNRRLYRRIEQGVRLSWWERLTRTFRPMPLRQALPLTATAGLLLMAGLLLQHPTPVAPARTARRNRARRIRWNGLWTIWNYCASSARRTPRKAGIPMPCDRRASPRLH